jgi:hypothetical protein
MKEFYIKPETFVAQFKCVDVVTTSATDDNIVEFPESAPASADVFAD